MLAGPDPISNTVAAIALGSGLVVSPGGETDTCRPLRRHVPYSLGAVTSDDESDHVHRWDDLLQSADYAQGFGYKAVMRASFAKCTR